MLYQGFYGRVDLQTKDEVSIVREMALTDVLGYNRTLRFNEVKLLAMASIRDEKITEQFKRYKEALIPGYHRIVKDQVQQGREILQHFRNVNFGDLFQVVPKKE